MTNPSSATWPMYDGPLGFNLNAKSTTFTVWAPTAQAVTLRLFEAGNNSEPIQTHEMKPLTDGAWRTNFRKRLDGVYYDYLVTFPDGTVNRTCDPWGVASGVNGERSLVIDEDRVTPANWHKDKSPKFVRHAMVVWETHVADFSNDPNGGFNPEHRGQYLAFTDEHTTLQSENSSTTDFPTGLDYLKQLGVTHVQLEPIYDFATVDEAALDAARKNGASAEELDSLYNWGYDPHAYNVPEGAYSSNPYDGTVRIRECKAMIAALHANGQRVIMDVVYNHMYRSAENAFELMVPGYFCRRNADDSFANGSGCGNEMASEHPMFRKFIIKSLLHWARDYHIDGFRFDLMGLTDTETLNQARAALDELPGGKDIVMYGEPWGASDPAVDEKIPMGDKDGRNTLNERIGWFSDESRDSLKGNVMNHLDRGYVNGNEFWCCDAARQTLDAWRDTPSAGKEVGQIVQYTSAHDDLTLWDKLCISMRENATDLEFSAQDAQQVADIMNANMFAAGMILCSAGTPFMLSGEEFGRTKHGCDNSYNRGILLNQLDWERAERFQPLVQWYRALIKLRADYSSLYDGKRKQLTTSNRTVLATRIGNNIIVCANPMYHEDATVELPLIHSEKSHGWHCVLNSSDYFAKWTGEQPDSEVRIESEGSSTTLHLPKRTFVVLSDK